MTVLSTFSPTLFKRPLPHSFSWGIFHKDKQILSSHPKSSKLIDLILKWYPHFGCRWSMGHLEDEKPYRSNKVSCESISGGELSTNFRSVRPRQELTNIGKLLLIWETQKLSLCVNVFALSFKYSQTVLIYFDLGPESSTIGFLSKLFQKSFHL